MKILLAPLLACLFALPSPAAEEGRPAARLVYSLNEVLLRRAGSADWGRAGERQALFRRDTLYTRAGARAEVEFAGGERLSLAPNTLAVLNPPGRRAADAEMVAGEMRGFKARLLTASAVITPKEKDTEYTARVGRDLSTVVKVARGAVDVEAQGKRIEVRAGFGLVVRSGAAPAAPVRLPAAAVPGSAPAAPEAASGLGVPDPKLVFTEPISGYRVQAARGKDFSAPLLDKVYSDLERPDLKALLPPGEYYLRVAPIDLLGYEGKFREPSKVRTE